MERVFPFCRLDSMSLAQVPIVLPEEFLKSFQAGGKCGFRKLNVPVMS